MRASLVPDASWVRPRPTPEALRRDVLLAGVLAVLAVATVELLRATPAGAAMNDRLAESFVLSVAITVPLALRRAFPVSVMVVCSVLFYVIGERVPMTGASAVVQVVLFMAIYAAWAWARDRRRLLVWSVLLGIGLVVWLVDLIGRADVPTDTPGLVPAGLAAAIVTLAINIVYVVGAVAWGLVSHRDAYRFELLAEQAEALRREQQRNAEQAVSDERLRIARDLHDSVAHHVTGIGVQAAAARHVLDRNPEGSRSALAAIEQSSRSAVREMHHLVGLLRAEDDTVRPGIAALPGLAERRDGDPLSVRFREVGAPFAVPDPVGSSLFRAAQEALTNVRRHSTAVEAELVLRYLGSGSGTGSPRAVEVEVLDAGSPRRVVEPGPAGFGLQGVRERAAAHDALVDIGPRPEGGFRVRVRFPLAAT